MTTSEISKSQRRLIARALSNYGYGLLQEIQSGEHPEQENDRLRAMDADCGHLHLEILSIEIENLDSYELELIEAAADGYCWKLRRTGKVEKVLEASDLERAVATIAEQVA